MTVQQNITPPAKPTSAYLLATLPANLTTTIGRLVGSSITAMNAASDARGALEKFEPKDVQPPALIDYWHRHNALSRQVETSYRRIEAGQEMLASLPATNAEEALILTLQLVYRAAHILENELSGVEIKRTVEQMAEIGNNVLSYMVATSGCDVEALGGSYYAGGRLETPLADPDALDRMAPGSVIYRPEFDAEVLAPGEGVPS